MAVLGCKSVASNRDRRRCVHHHLDVCGSKSNTPGVWLCGTPSWAVSVRPKTVVRDIDGSVVDRVWHCSCSCKRTRKHMKQRRLVGTAVVATSTWLSRKLSCVKLFVCGGSGVRKGLFFCSWGARGSRDKEVRCKNVDSKLSMSTANAIFNNEPCVEQSLHAYRAGCVYVRDPPTCEVSYFFMCNMNESTIFFCCHCRIIFVQRTPVSCFLRIKNFKTTVNLLPPRGYYFVRYTEEVFFNLKIYGLSAWCTS